MRKYQFEVRLQRQEDGLWRAEVTSLPGCFADAETVYKKDLEQHPHNGWALLGLQQALKAQGKTDPAVDADLAKSWSRSDTWIKASRF